MKIFRETFLLYAKPIKMGDSKAVIELPDLETVFEEVEETMLMNINLYSMFLIKCDRENLPLISYNDYIKNIMNYETNRLGV